MNNAILKENNKECNKVKKKQEKQAIQKEERRKKQKT